MLGLFTFKKDLRVYVAGSDKPRKFTWNELGQYLVNEALIFGQADVNSMRSRRKAKLLTKFLNAPIGTRMISTAFYLFIYYKTVSKLLEKGNEIKNRQALLEGFESGLAKIKASGKNVTIFTSKHIDFIVRYMHFLETKSAENSFDPGALYATSLYKFYKMNTSSDLVLEDECKQLASYMNKRYVECNKRISKRISIKTL